MLDGGSGVNSTTEEIILQVLNENSAAGISLSDKRHPIKSIERWKHEEALRGVAGGANVPLLGAVVVAVNLIEVGKQDGPEVLIRFKICKAGSTDWVGWIMGARCIDCPENGGLGFIPMPHSHSFTALSIQTERSERPGTARPDRCYAARLSVLDSDDSDNEEQRAGAARPLPSGPSLAPAASAGIPLLYEGDPISIGQGEGAWVPVVVATSAVEQQGTPGNRCVFPCVGSPVEVVPGIWNEENGQGTVCVVGIDEFDTVLEPGTKVAEVHSAVVQTRVCQQC